MSNTTKPRALPEVTAVGQRAAALLTRVQGDPEYTRLVASSERYADCWACFTGYMTISEWNEKADAPRLFIEGLRVLMLKAAVYELTDGDEHAAELVVPAPVDEMVHAIIAQATLVGEIANRQGFPFVHMTDCETFGYRTGSYAHQAYLAAGWDEPEPRYWLDGEEYQRRLKILTERYTSIGIHDGGRSHNLDFAAPAA